MGRGCGDFRLVHPGPAGIGRCSGAAAWPVLAVLVLALCILAPVRAADIRATPHNLARQGSLVAADEVCVFCHTPQLRAGVTGMQPAWQPSMPTTHAFDMFDDIGRRQFGKKAIGSQSVACLSCHDGSQAFMVTSSTMDHPFGVPYRGFSRDREMADKRGGKNGHGGEAERTEEEGRRAAHYGIYETEFRPPSEGVVEDRRVWWVSASGTGSVRSRSDLPLYARLGDDGEIPYIECGSCHDPHVVRPLFLRLSNAGSKLCLTCHQK